MRTTNRPCSLAYRRNLTSITTESPRHGILTWKGHTWEPSIPLSAFLIRSSLRSCSCETISEISWHDREPNPKGFARGARKQASSRSYLEVDGLAGALEVDLDEEQPLIVLAADGLEAAAASDDVEEHEVVGGRQVVEVVLRRRRLRRPRDLIPHHGGRRRSPVAGSPTPPPTSPPPGPRLAGVWGLLRSAGASWRCVGRRRSIGYVRRPSWCCVCWARTRYPICVRACVRVFVRFGTSGLDCLGPPGVSCKSFFTVHTIWTEGSFQPGGVGDRTEWKCIQGSPCLR
jgi:hypothetical protein